MIQEAIKMLVNEEDLSGEQAREVATEIMNGDALPTQIAAFITALRLRGEQVEHIVGFTEVMREKATPIAPPQGIVLDTCGTGGDETGTFNISTVAAIIAAGAGVTVAKHGNRSVSSVCGSADVLKELGVKIDVAPAVSEKCLHEIGLCFMFAPLYHGAMKHAIGPRREIGIRTIFNLIGPLSNPAGATHQLLGVYDHKLTEIFAHVLAELGSRHALIVHGSDGLDEITTTTATTITEMENGEIETAVIEPADFGLKTVELADIIGGDAAENAAITRAILAGEEGSRADIALLNAGAAIYIGGQADSIELGINVARETIASGKAAEKLAALVELTNAEAPPEK